MKKFLIIFLLSLFAKGAVHAQVNEVTYRVKVNRLYSAADEGNDTRHRWELKYRFSDTGAWVPFPDSKGLFDRNTGSTGWILTPDREVLSEPLTVYHPYIEIQLHGWEVDNSGNHWNCTTSRGYYFGEPNQWLNDLIISCTDETTYKADISIKYDILEPAANIRVRDTDSATGDEIINHCEGNEVYLSLDGAKDDLVEKYGFEYFWEYHMNGQHYDYTTCTVASGAATTDPNLRVESSAAPPSGDCDGSQSQCTDSTPYDPSCQHCECTTTRTDTWLRVEHLIDPANLQNFKNNKFRKINFTAAKQGAKNYDQMKFRISIRPVTNDYNGVTKENSLSYIDIQDPPPTLDNYPKDGIQKPEENFKVKENYETFVHTIEPDPYTVVNISAATDTVDEVSSMKIRHVDCKGDQTGKVIIKKVTGNGPFYYNLRKVDEGGRITYNINGSKVGAYATTSSRVTTAAPPPGDGPIDIDPGDGGLEPDPSTNYIIFPDHIPENYDNSTTNDVAGLPAGIYLLRIENLKNAEAGGMDADTTSDGSLHQIRMCYETYTVIIREPATEVTGTDNIPSTISRNGFHVSCHDGSDGQVRVNATGGIGGAYKFHLYQKDDTPVLSTTAYTTSAIFSDLSATNGSVDEYYALAEDKLGCLSEKIIIDIEEPPLLVLNDPNPYEYEAGFEISCKNGIDGNIEVSATGGAGEYTFYLLDSDDNQLDQITDVPAIENSAAAIYNFPDDGDNNFALSAGTYKIRIVDGNGCEALKSVELREPTAIAGIDSNPVPPVCIGGSDGSITITASGGIPKAGGIYRIYIEGFENDPEKDKEGSEVILEGLEANVSYNVVIEGEYCSGTLPVDIPENPDPLTIEVETVEPPSCAGLYDGSITVKARNGVLVASEKLVFTLTGLGYSDEAEGVNGESVTFEGLTNTGYSIEVRDKQDEMDCTDKINQLIPIRPDPLTLIVDEVIMPSCHGFSDGSITFRAEGGDSPYSFSTDQSSFTEDADEYFTISGLSANTTDGYTVSVRDKNYTSGFPTSCVSTANTVLNEPSDISINEAITHVQCYGESTGVIEVTPSGGTPANGYNYEWTVSGSTTILGTAATLADMPAGNYRVKVTNGSCPPKFEAFTITQPFQLDFNTLTPSPTSCEGRNDGFVTMEAKGGTAPFQYTVDGNTQSYGFFKDLVPGVHTASISDKYGCTVDSTFTIGIGEIVLDITSVTHETCSDSEDGSVSLSASGGSGPYEYSLNGAGFASLSNIYGLSAGDYTVIARDATGCESAGAIFSISEPDTLIVSASLVRDAACGLAIGAAEATATGGTPFAGDDAYTVEWLDNNLQQVNPDSLYSGTYTVQINDANGCTASDEVTINELPPHTLTFEVTDTPYCDLAIGSAQVNVTGGVGPFTYRWNDTAATTLAVASGLREGNYTVWVTDQYRGCVQQVRVVLTDGAPLVADHTSVSATCNQADGSAQVTVTGGVLPYTYDWGDADAAASADDLFAGVYPVTITDNVGCQLVHNVNVSNEDGPSLDAVSVQQSWCGLPTGQAEVTVSGGTLPYTYKWIGTNPVQASATATGLLAGSYTVEITDATGCILAVPVSVTDDATVVPSIEVAGVTNSACGLSIGSAEVAMSGGLAPYSYQWQSPLTTTGAAAENLAAGVYEVIGTDAKGCTQSIQVTIEDNPDPVLSFVSKTKSACGQPFGTATVSASGGAAPYSYQWSDANNQTAATATDLFAGSYEVYGIDNNGCTTNSLTVKIEDETGMQLKTAAVTPASCAGAADGQAEVSVNMGLPPYSYLWNDPSAQTTARATGLAGGDYSVTVTDSNDCSAELTITVPAPDEVKIINISEVQPDCYGDCNGSLQVFAAGGNGTYSYKWADGQTQAQATGLCAGDYAVEITDTNGCTVVQTISLGQPDKIMTTGIPRHEILCEGQDITIDAGEEWIDYSWKSPAGFSSTEQVVTLSDPGEYFLTVHSEKNCVVQDTFLLETRADLLQAKFLMSSESMVGDTVVVVDISWPEPESITWELPAEANELNSGGFFKDIQFNQPGTYTVKMKAYLGECEDLYQKSITIIGQGTANSAGRTGEEGPIREFRLFPNPNSGNFTVKVELAKAAPITLSIISMQDGLVVSRYKNEGKTSYEAAFNLPGIANGVYLVNLQTEGGERNIRFIVN